MKKNKLGITEGVFSEKDGRVFTEDGTTICYLNNAEFESVENGQLIADAFNTANECGLLPSELLEKMDELLKLLIKKISDTINQIEQ